MYIRVNISTIATLLFPILCEKIWKYLDHIAFKCIHIFWEYMDGIDGHIEKVLSKYLLYYPGFPSMGLVVAVVWWAGVECIGKMVSKDMRVCFYSYLICSCQMKYQWTQHLCSRPSSSKTASHHWRFSTIKFTGHKSK